MSMGSNVAGQAGGELASLLMRALQDPNGVLAEIINRQQQLEAIIEKVGPASTVLQLREEAQKLLEEKAQLIIKKESEALEIVTNAKAQAKTILDESLARVAELEAQISSLTESEADKRRELASLVADIAKRQSDYAKHVDATNQGLEKAKQALAQHELNIKQENLDLIRRRDELNALVADLKSRVESL